MAVSLTRHLACPTAFLLFGLLVLLLFLAVSITLSGLGIYLTLRLLFHLRDANGGGVKAWTAEVRSFIPNVQAIQTAAVQLRNRAGPDDRVADREPWASEGISVSTSASTGEAASQSDVTPTT